MKDRTVLRTFCIITVLAWVSCKDQATPPEISTPSAGRVSGCGGFESVAKKRADADSYCAAERLIWEFSPDTKRLTLTHQRFVENCCADITVSASRTGDTIHVEESIDLSKICKCLCTFDSEVELDRIEHGRLFIGIRDTVIGINTAEMGGVAVLDTSATSYCMQE